MTHLPEMVLSRCMVRSVAPVLSLYLTRSCWQALLPDMTHSINDKTISGLGSFRTYGSLRCVDSFLWDGPLLIDDSFTFRGSLKSRDSFYVLGSLAKVDSFVDHGSLYRDDSFFYFGSL